MSIRFTAPLPTTALRMPHTRLDAKRSLTAIWALAALSLPAGAVWAQSVASALAAQPTAFAAPEPDAAAPLRIQAGKQQSLRLGHGIARLAVGNPAVLDAKVLRENAGKAVNAELLLTALAPGETTLVVWPQRGAAPQTWQVSVYRQGLVLDRSLRSLPEHAQVLSVLQQTAPEGTPVQDLSRVEVKSNTVQVDVQVVEFKKSALKQAGINILSRGANDHGFNFGMYSPGSGGHQSASGVSSAMNLVMGFGRAFSGAGLDVQLNLLEGNGLARVLAKPTLVAHSGQSASFLAGGELPVPVPGSDGTIGIEYKEFGVKLQLSPTILANDRIALKIAPESSDLDFSSGVAISGVAVPGIRTRRADTMVELADGESFVIGGLVSRNTTSNVNKVPLLGDLPVLGTFFKNLSYSQDETELVIIVTPHLVQPIAAGTDLERLLPGARSERPNAAQVWEPFIAGGLKPDAALPGFSQ